MGSDFDGPAYGWRELELGLHPDDPVLTPPQLPPLSVPRCELAVVLFNFAIPWLVVPVGPGKDYQPGPGSELEREAGKLGRCA